MFYKIVGVSSQCPDQPTVYRGEFLPIPSEHPILTALVKEFGTEEELAIFCLGQWSGGEITSWANDLGLDEVDTWEFRCGDTTFYVFIDEDGVIT